MKTVVYNPMEYRKTFVRYFLPSPFFQLSIVFFFLFSCFPVFRQMLLIKALLQPFKEAFWIYGRLIFPKTPLIWMGNGAYIGIA